MDRYEQQGPAGLAVTWSEGEPIEAKLSISNMHNILIAQAQGVRASGHLVVDIDENGKPVYPITLNTCLKYPRGGFYIRLVDKGITESGEGAPFREIQFAVESLETLPQ